MAKYKDNVDTVARAAKFRGVPFVESQTKQYFQPLVESLNRHQESEGRFLRLLLSLGVGVLAAWHIFPGEEAGVWSEGLTKVGMVCNLIGIIATAVALYKETYSKKFEYDVLCARLQKGLDPDGLIVWKHPFILRYSVLVAYATFLLAAIALTLGVLLR